MKSEQQNILTPEQNKEVAAFAKEQFAFLKTEKGFSKPLINQPSNGLLIYRNATMGIGIEMHFSFPGYYYDSMEVTIGKLGSDGNFPKFPYTGEGHMRLFWVLQSFLIRQLHVQDEHILALDQLLRSFRRKGGTWDVEQWKQIINLHQVLVYKHVDLILQQPSEVLFPTAIEYLLMGRKAFAQLAYNCFAFLHEYGFRFDPIVEDYGAKYTWISKDRGIQLSQDYQDGTISFSIIKLIDGKLPTFDKRELKRDDFIQGKRVIILLDDLLTKRLGVSDAQIDTIRNIHNILTLRDRSDYDYTYTSTVIRTYADLVRRYINQLMQVPF